MIEWLKQGAPAETINRAVGLMLETIIFDFPTCPESYL
jgi:hypothetical protein